MHKATGSVESLASPFLPRAGPGAEADLLAAAAPTNASPLTAARGSRELGCRRSDSCRPFHTAPCWAASSCPAASLVGSAVLWVSSRGLTTHVPGRGGGVEQLQQLIRLWLKKFLSKSPYKELAGLELYIIPSVFLGGTMLPLLLTIIQPK